MCGGYRNNIECGKINKPKMVNAPEGLNQVHFLPKTLKTFAKLTSPKFHKK